MYCSIIITVKSRYFVYTFIVLPAAKCCCSTHVNKSQEAANAVALQFRVRNVMLEKNVKGIGGPD